MDGLTWITPFSLQSFKIEIECAFEPLKAFGESIGVDEARRSGEQALHALLDRLDRAGISASKRRYFRDILFVLAIEERVEISTQFRRRWLLAKSGSLAKASSCSTSRQSRCHSRSF